MLYLHDEYVNSCLDQDPVFGFGNIQRMSEDNIVPLSCVNFGTKLSEVGQRLNFEYTKCSNDQY